MTTDVRLDKNSLARLKKQPERAVQAVAEGLREGLALVERDVKADWLSGRALKRRTGRLRGSITTEVKVHGAVASGRIGTNVAYGRFWELGFKGVVQVRAHARNIRQAFGRAITPKSILVGVHSRNLDVKARPFLKPALDANRDRIAAAVRARLTREFS